MFPLEYIKYFLLKIKTLQNLERLEFPFRESIRSFPTGGRVTTFKESISPESRIASTTS